MELLIKVFQRYQRNEMSIIPAPHSGPLLLLFQLHPLPQRSSPVRGFIYHLHAEIFQISNSSSALSVKLQSSIYNAFLSDRHLKLNMSQTSSLIDIPNWMSNLPITKSDLPSVFPISINGNTSFLFLTFLSKHTLSPIYILSVLHLTYILNPTSISHFLCSKTPSLLSSIMPTSS